MDCPSSVVEPSGETSRYNGHKVLTIYVPVISEEAGRTSRDSQRARTRPTTALCSAIGPRSLIACLVPSCRVLRYPSRPYRA
jgi:hypothetical protein